MGKGRLKKGARSKYLTPSGKRVIALCVPPELEDRILAAAKAKGFTRQSYILSAVNEALKDDEREQRQVPQSDT